MLLMEFRKYQPNYFESKGRGTKPLEVWRKFWSTCTLLSLAGCKTCDSPCGLLLKHCRRARCTFPMGGENRALGPGEKDLQRRLGSQTSNASFRPLTASPCHTPPCSLTSHEHKFQSASFPLAIHFTTDAVGLTHSLK